jgi:DNA replication protein DnaC
VRTIRTIQPSPALQTGRRDDRPRCPAPLPADLEAGLRRLRLAAIRRSAPDVLATARAHRWAPDELLRVLVDTEIAARDESNCRNRMAAARFPVIKTVDEFTLAESTIPPASHDYLVTFEWIRRADNLCVIGRPAPAKPTNSSASPQPPSGTDAGSATSPPSSSTRSGFAPLDHTGCQLLFGIVAAAYDRLCHHAHIITSGDSCRLRHRTTRGGTT